jgi:hypothetical protein
VLTTPEVPVLAEPAAPARRKRPLLITAIVAVVLLLLLVAANFAVVQVAQGRISDRLGCRFGDSADIDVSVAGGWNGLGVLRGDLGDVRVTAKGAKAGAATADVDAHVAGVGIQDKTLSSTGGELSATVAFADLSQLISAAGGKPVDVKGYGGQLMLAAGGDAGLAGQIALLSQVSVEPRLLRLTPTAVVLGERQIPVEQARSLIASRSPDAAKSLAVRDIPLTSLPESVQLTAATVTSTGLTVKATLSALDLTSGGSTGTAGCTR